MPPHRIRRRPHALLIDLEHTRDALQRKEKLHFRGGARWQFSKPYGKLLRSRWRLQQRQRLGALQQVPRHFYAGIWELLHHCRGMVIGDKLERRDRLESRPLNPGDHRGRAQFR